MTAQNVPENAPREPTKLEHHLSGLEHTIRRLIAAEERLESALYRLRGEVPIPIAVEKTTPDTPGVMADLSDQNARLANLGERINELMTELEEYV